MCPVGTWWSHSQCTQWWDHNVLSGHMLSSFKMYPVMGSQCSQWAHVGFFHNVPINVITMSPVAYIMVSFAMFFTMYPACPWATHWEFFQKLSSNVITMSSESFFQCNPQCSWFLPWILKELNEDVVEHIVITSLDNFWKNSQWVAQGHAGYIVKNIAKETIM